MRIRLNVSSDKVEFGIVAVEGSDTPSCFPAREPVVAIEEGVETAELFLCNLGLCCKFEVFSKPGRPACA